jgi:hypothetical protein
MKLQEIIDELKRIEDPFTLDPHIDDDGNGINLLAGYVSFLRRRIEQEGLEKE